MIEIRGLTKKFDTLTALEDVSFRVEGGETFALLGPNGSGKTTALKCIVGLMSPSAGQVLIEGIDVTKGGRTARQRLSYLPQRVAFPESVTAREILEFYCRLRKVPLNRIEPALAKASFNGLADRPVTEFSGGMVQRLGLAVAFLPDAPLLVLDEPTVSLDPEGAARFKALLASLKREGKTIIFSSHILSDVDELADRVAILVGGRLVAVESVEALLRVRTAHAHLRLELRNPEPKLAEVALASGAIQARLVGNALIVRAKPEDRLAVIHAVERACGLIDQFSTEEPSIEEIYLQYVQQTNSLDVHSAPAGLSQRGPETG